jgi:transposase
MRFVPVKSDDQLGLQSLHRVRERWVMRTTAVVDQIRGLLLERGAACLKPEIDTKGTVLRKGDALRWGLLGYLFRHRTIS